VKVHLDCFPCFLRQALIALRLGTNDQGVQEQILRSVMEEVICTDTSRPPAYTTSFIHRKIRKLLGKDPFREIKSEYNRIALRLFGSLKEIVESSIDPLWTAVRLAISGNVIDFGIFTHIDIEGTIGRALEQEIAIDDYILFREAISSAGEVLYLLDNAGEIVFDRILIEAIQCRGAHVVAVVKGLPVINDCTWSDAVESGLTEVCEVIDNGSDAVGTIFDETTWEFRERYVQAPLVISKGQANFETIQDAGKEICYLFQSKCDVLSGELGLSTGAMVLKKSGKSRGTSCQIGMKEVL
jgi:uncharacterized protein with ATP-grasp and redox domains